MSLIQEALTRKSEEVPGIQPLPPVETSEPAADRKRPQPFLILSTVVLIAGLIVVLAGLGIYLLKPKQRILPPVVQPAAAPVAPPAVPEPVAVSEPAMPDIKTREAKTVIITVGKEESASAVQTKWPELNLTGIAQSGTQRIAVINGKMLPAGRKTGEVIVREVNITDVVLEYRGERRVLYIDE
jgi:hypothetical protein